MTMTVARPPDTDELISTALRHSIQTPPTVSRDGITAAGFVSYGGRTNILPAYGTRAREVKLRELYRMDEMWLVRGAFTGVAKAVAGLPWEIKGDDTPDPLFGELAEERGWSLTRSDGVAYFQEVFRQANFGAGWGTLISQCVLDFLRYDAGAYIEIIGSGDSANAPTGPMAGIAHLDPIYTYPTGDPRYPAIYYDNWGGLHVLNHARVIRLLDMDDGDQQRPGYGDSALSRAISIAIRQVNETRYISARLDDKPPPGLTMIGGIMKAEWETEQAKYRAQQATDAKPTYGQRQFYFTPDPAYMPEVKTYEFSSPPEKFDFRSYVDIDVDALALAMGVDRQELMQLSGGGAIGSQGQSVVLAQKARGKTIGYLVTQLERKLNDLLPKDYTFEFKVRDSQEALEDAQRGQIWAGVAATLASILNPQELRTLVQNEVEAVRDAISDAPRANDVDTRPVVAEDDTPGSEPIAAPPATNEPSTLPAEAQKDYGTTEAQFVSGLTRIIASAAETAPYIRLDRRGFGIAVRSLLKQYGTQAYKDGLAKGGVTVDVLDPEDSTAVSRIFVEQSGYISGLADAVYADKSLTPETAHSRAQMWTKSLQEFLNAGLVSADRNGMYMWRRGPTSDSCATCLRMNGQVHRLKTYTARGIMPKSNTLACNGFQCLCYLEKTTEKARGKF